MAQEKLEWVAEEGLSEEAKSGIEKLNQILFPENLIGGRYRFGAKQADPHRLLLWSDGTLAGQLITVRRDARVNSESLNIAYVGEIGVLPEFQGKGMGKKLLTHLEKYFPNDADVALLCCVKEKQGFYEKCGWQLLDMKLFLGPDDERSRCADGIVMARLKSQKARDLLEGKSTSLFIGEPV